MQKMYPNFVWEVETNKKEIFLTFDDGPVPEVTEFVLEELKKYDAKATFFCVGENLKKYPDVAKQVVIEGHAIGNHTFNHLKGWRTNNHTYHQNVLKCEEQLKEFHQDKLLFRPPYGRIKRAQAKALSNYKIVMWNRLSWDFGKNLNHKKAIHYLTDASPGSIFVFHDNKKSFKNMSVLLPVVLKYYKERDFEFKALSV
ncbi:MAG: polysaccharide deacetylase family protein [Cytophagales bacterium]|nr:polysaccharide deacetylase family protein [Cytophagales bacterium]